MSKLSLVERNKKRIKLYNKYKAKHDKLLKQANNKKLSPEEQFQARLKLSKIPRNASRGRIEDADFALETAKFTKSQIISQAASSMLAQANANSDVLLRLIN